MGKHHLNAKRIIIIIINLKQVFKSFTEFSKSFLPSHQIAMIPSHKVSTRLFIPMSSLDEDQFTSGDRRGPANSARKSAATKPRSRAHARANRFPMRFYLIAVCVVLLQCHPVCAGGPPGQQKVRRRLPTKAAQKFQIGAYKTKVVLKFQPKDLRWTELAQYNGLKAEVLEVRGDKHKVQITTQNGLHHYGNGDHRDAHYGEVLEGLTRKQFKVSRNQRQVGHRRRLSSSASNLVQRMEDVSEYRYQRI